jgi:hypothetical protein
MFGSLERSLETYRVECFANDFLLRAQLTPLGELLVYLNDRRREFMHLDAVELQALTADRQLRPIQRDVLNVNKRTLLALSMLDDGEAQRVQVIAARRPVVFYLGPLIVRGQLHVNVDASADDLMDDSRDYYPISQANIFYVRATPPKYTREVPLFLVNRSLVQAYHSDNT